MFTSSVLNQERNAALFESVLTTQYSLQLQDDPLADASYLGAAGPADYVLEMADCEAFIAAYDSAGNGSISVEDFGRAI